MITVEVEGVQETIYKIRGLDRDLQKEANAEVRLAAKETAQELAAALTAAASSSGVPVAPLVAKSIKVKSDRFPTVVIGGSKKVGRRGATAGALAWGSDRGGATFGVPVASSYWIAPTVERFERSAAVPNFTRAIESIIHRYGLE